MSFLNITTNAVATVPQSYTANLQNAPGIVAAGDITDVDNRHAPKLSGKVWTGMLAEYADIVGESTEAPLEFHLGAFLTIIGVLLMRRVWVNLPRPTFGNLYTILIGGTSKTRKSTAYGIAVHLMTMIAEVLGAEVRPLYGLSSAEGLAEAMEGQDGCGIPTLIIEDEFRSLMTKAQQKGVSNLVPKLTELYNGGEKFEVPTRTNLSVWRSPWLA
jgi:hypothetical protein